MKWGSLGGKSLQDPTLMVPITINNYQLFRQSLLIHDKVVTLNPFEEETYQNYDPFKAPERFVTLETKIGELGGVVCWEEY